MIYSTLEQPNLKNTIITIGVFDGVHQGHSWLLNHLIQSKNEKNASLNSSEFRSVVVTFDPHPEEILFGKKTDYYLTTTQRKIEKLKVLGIDDIVIIPFSKEISNYSSRKFVKKLSNHLGMKELWVGNDFALGKKREGTIPKLRTLGEEFGFSVKILVKKNTHEHIISSSTVRELLKNGSLRKANEYLNSPYILSGEIILGDQRGRTIGFPTANLKIDNRMLIPKFGVYTAFAKHNKKTYPSVVNIGVRPTFNSTELRIEAHLLNFPNQEIYGDWVELSLINYIREEKKFSTLDELIKQIEKDSQLARKILS